MAIQKAIVLDSGISLPTAYHKISDIRISRKFNEENIVKFQVDIFADEAARTSDKAPVKSLFATCTDQTFVGLDALNVEGANIFTKCYDFLKTQMIDGFDYTIDATDVL